MLTVTERPPLPKMKRPPEHEAPAVFWHMNYKKIVRLTITSRMKSTRITPVLVHKPPPYPPLSSPIPLILQIPFLIEII